LVGFSFGEIATEVAFKIIETRKNNTSNCEKSNRNSKCANSWKIKTTEA
jgi:hypothetical protein